MPGEHAFEEGELQPGAQVETVIYPFLLQVHYPDPFMYQNFLLLQLRQENFKEEGGLLPTLESMSRLGKAKLFLVQKEGILKEN